MKKRILSALVAASMLTSSAAFAMGYSSRAGNPATLETLGEARQSMITAVAEYAGEADYVSAASLDICSQDHVYVYRSSNIWGSIRQAAKMNTVLYVVTGDEVTDADAYLDSLGLKPIIEECGGSILLITPIDAAAGYTAADAEAFKALQNAAINIKGTMVEGEATKTLADAEYFGGYGFQYAIGIGKGADFVNKYLATDLEAAGKLAGLALIGGESDEAFDVACAIPAYLSGAKSAAVEAYTAANAENELCAVVTADVKDAAEAVKEGYYDLLIKSERISPTGGTLPYVLCERNAVLNGVTPDKIHVTYQQNDRFADIRTVTDLYLDAWYECLPEEVLDNTAPAGSIPLILCMYGMGDDPLMFVDNNGFLSLAGKQRIALVAPEHQDIFWCLTDAGFVDGIEMTVMPALVRYMLETYPALDASRVYVTGYSMGGWATNKVIHGDPSLFAAIAPMSGITLTPTEEQAAQFESIDIPTMISTSKADLGLCYDAAADTLGGNHVNQVRIYASHNEITLPEEADYTAYPMIGIPYASMKETVLNGGYTNYRWTINNDEGVPMMCISVTEELVHSLFPEFAKLMWEFASQYSRDTATGAVVYTAK